MSSIEKRRCYFFLFLALASLLPYFIISMYAHPAGDDFVYAYNGQHFSLTENSARDYFEWNGRYIANLLVVLNPMAFDSLGSYKLFADLLILLTFISFYFLVKTVTNNSFTKIYSILFSGVLTLLFLQQMPSLSQGIYWYTGAVTYQGANILTLFYISALINLLREKYFINKIIHILFCSILIFVITGFNETAMVFLLLFHAFLFIKNKNELLFFIFIFSLLCSLVVILAPGNSVREAVFPGRHQFFYSLFFSLAQSARFFLKWVTGIPLILASLVYIPVSMHISEKPVLFRNNFYLSPVSSTCLLFIMIFLSAFPSYWSMGMLAQHRTVNAAYFFFLILWFINLSAWINFLKKKKIIITLSNFTSKYFSILFILILLFSFMTGNGYRVLSDLFSGKAKNFDREMRLRYEILNSAGQNPEKICRVDSLQNKPASLFVLDITENENDWMNRGMAAYFGINKLSLKK
jgi:uncharacterized protein DUF6056